MRWLLLALLLLLAALQYRLWFAEGSLAEQRRLELQVVEQTEINLQLRERNAVLEREVLELQSGNRSVEQRAREQLGLVRKGETFYQVVEQGAEQGAKPGVEPKEQRDPAGDDARGQERP